MTEYIITTLIVCLFYPVSQILRLLLIKLFDEVQNEQ